MDVASDFLDFFVERRSDGGFSFGGGHGSNGDERSAERGSDDGSEGGTKHARRRRRWKVRVSEKKGRLERDREKRKDIS